MRFILLFALVALLGACQSAPKPETSGMPTQAAPQRSKPVVKEAPWPPVDLKYVQRHLNMPVNKDLLGHHSKSFNTCKMRGYPKGNCRKNYMSVLNFQMYCRDSVGTVEYVDQSSYEPVRSENLKWLVPGTRNKGVTSLSQNGRGQILALSEKPLKYNRVILINGENSLQLRFNQVSKIVVPSDWCR